MLYKERQTVGQSHVGKSYVDESMEAKIYFEMEFLDINFTKYSSPLLYTVQSQFYWRILKKNSTLLWF
jgi:hypothetical protein